MAWIPGLSHFFSSICKVHLPDAVLVLNTAAPPCQEAALRWPLASRDQNAKQRPCSHWFGRFAGSLFSVSHFQPHHFARIRHEEVETCLLCCKSSDAMTWCWYFMSITFYFIILNLIDNYDLSKCAQVHCGLWFFGLHQLTLSFHIHVFPHRFSPHWANGAPPPLQPLLNRRLHLLAPQLLSQLHALHGPTGQLQPPDGNFIPCIVSYHIVSYHLILFHLILILSHLYIYTIYTISACTMYAILHYTYHIKSFPQIIVWNTVYLPREFLSKKTNGKFIGKNKGVLSFRGWPHHTLRALPRN